MAHQKFGEDCVSQGYNNNRCSGYALASIVTDMWLCHNYPIKTPAKYKELGMYLYDDLCLCQRKLLEGYAPESISIQFINSSVNIAGGTCMIFPSSIVHYSLMLGLSCTLFYSPEENNIFRTEVFEEDCERMNGFLYQVSAYSEFKQKAREYQYLLALTRYKHWVALKSVQEGYYLFDPAPGEFGGGVSGPDTFETLLPQMSEKYQSKYFYGILIGLCPGDRLTLK